ncbi:MAG: diaminopimelate decarboxylase, partial [Phycisphaeraceae bacterium JB051]
MDDFQYRNGQLFAEDVNIDELAAKVGTPMYVYSKKTLLTHFNKLREAFAAVDPVICYSIKSCGNINLLKLLASEGAGMDV